MTFKSSKYICYFYGTSIILTYYFENINLSFSLFISNEYAKQDSVILLPAHPAFFTHNFVYEMQSFYFSESQDAMVLQTCHEK